MPVGEDNPESHAAFVAWLNDQGLVYHIKDLEGEDDTHPTHNKYYEEGSAGCVGWEPVAPDGDGWFTLSIHDSEDGPVWVWVRREADSPCDTLEDESAILDEHAVDLFANAMKDKLQLKREQGSTGWNDIGRCTGEHLAQSLLEAVAKGDPVDVANFAMMLFCRHEEHDALKTAYAAVATESVFAHRTAVPVLSEEAINALQGMLEDGESEYGIGYCDCQQEPENAGHVCNACKARDVLTSHKELQ